MPSTDITPKGTVYNVLDYSDVEACAKVIGAKMSAANYCPDLIVGVARGGSIPAAMLAYELQKWFNHPGWAIATVFAKSYEGQDKGKRMSVEVPNIIKTMMHQSTKVLIVDDIHDSGDTLTAIDYNLRDSRRRVDIRTATLLTKDHAGPDFYGRLIDSDRHHEWVVFPWEV